MKGSEFMQKILSFLDHNRFRILGWILVLVLVYGLSMILESLWKPKAKNPPKAQFPKADYSSDRSWLECRDHQLVCLYSGLWEELSPKQIMDVCGQQEVCDDLFGGGMK